MRITKPETFMENWEKQLPEMPAEELRKWLGETSPHHPNGNVRWLYDRILWELSHRITAEENTGRKGD